MRKLLGVGATAAAGYNFIHGPRAEGGWTLMSTQTIDQPRTEIVDPESDGNPMADNTLQFRWIVKIQGGLDAWFRHSLVRMPPACPGGSLSSSLRRCLLMPLA
jgi:hypothetical protein